MTNLQAIDLLKGLEQSLDDYCELNDEGKTAFGMAISALNCSEIPNNSDTINRQAAIDALLGITAMRNTIPLDSAIFNIKKLPSAQPERKDAVEKAVAVEAISDELMSRFDVSATYGYDFAEAVINRIEAMAKELERGEQK